ncbi:hypothetical protein [Legionella quinlivanii]|uniref:hypothetical protein n=1 Tax=Legionella quinlivanii TaxID=45073 RepID=UPI0022434C60|nr:hypothetical protein [Legionella quinlivanii]MCW8451826.1 hypothetical protein [Legionella quinlivanii]
MFYQEEFPVISEQKMEEYESKWGLLKEWEADERKLFFGTEGKKMNRNCLFYKPELTYQGPSRVCEDPRLKSCRKF